MYFSVVQLQDAIMNRCHIPRDKQVLLISGGDSLDPSARVCSYSAGTVSMLQIYCSSVACSLHKFSMNVLQNILFYFIVSLLFVYINHNILGLFELKKNVVNKLEAASY